MIHETGITVNFPCDAFDVVSDFYFKDMTYTPAESHATLFMDKAK